MLAKDKGAIDEILAVAPVALANLVHAYQENTGTLGTRSNLTLGLQDPAKLCGFFDCRRTGHQQPARTDQPDRRRLLRRHRQAGRRCPVFPSSVQNRLQERPAGDPGAS